MTSSKLIFHNPIDRDLNSDLPEDGEWETGWFFQLEDWLTPVGPIDTLESCEMQCSAALANWWQIPILERERMRLALLQK